MMRLTRWMLCWALLLTGCQSPRISLKPLPARSFPTQGGDVLEMAGKMLTIRPNPGDVESALGVGLSEKADAVVVTNEVGLGVVPAHRSGMLFRDQLGIVNQRVAAVCDEVHLVIAGRVLKI